MRSLLPLASEQRDCAFGDVNDDFDMQTTLNEELKKEVVELS